MTQVLVPPAEVDTTDGAERLRRRTPWTPILAATLVAAGAAAGTAVGLATDTEYEVRQSVQIDQILDFEPWESSAETARFGQTLRRADLQQEAADSVGSGIDLSRVTADSGDGSAVVTVSLVTDDRERGPEAIATLIDRTVASLIESDRVRAGQTVELAQTELAEVEAQIKTLVDTVGVAPGTNLGDVLNRSQFDLTTARAQLATTEDSYWISRLPGEIVANEALVESISPIIDEWYGLNNRRSELRNRISPAREQLAVLDVGSQILQSGAHRGSATVSAVSRRATIGRFSAGGAALGLAGALGLLALTDRRRIRSLRST